MLCVFIVSNVFGPLFVCISVVKIFKNCFRNCTIVLKLGVWLWFCIWAKVRIKTISMSISLQKQKTKNGHIHIHTCVYFTNVVHLVSYIMHNVHYRVFWLVDMSPSIRSRKNNFTSGSWWVQCWLITLALKSERWLGQILYPEFFFLEVKPLYKAGEIFSKYSRCVSFHHPFPPCL